MTKIGAFLRAPAWRRRLALEAAWELLRARLLTLRPASKYTAALGTLVDAEPPADAGQPPAGDTAWEIGGVVAAVARCLPFRAVCLEQAIAVRRMLTRRRIPAMVYLGIARDRTDRVSADAARAAHAWVSVGSRIVNGDGVADRYAIVARFA